MCLKPFSQILLLVLCSFSSNTKTRRCWLMCLIKIFSLSEDQTLSLKLPTSAIIVSVSYLSDSIVICTLCKIHYVCAHSLKTFPFSITFRCVGSSFTTFKTKRLFPPMLVFITLLFIHIYFALNQVFHLLPQCPDFTFVKWSCSNKRVCKTFLTSESIRFHLRSVFL